MAKNDGTFGFEDLQKAFNRIEQKYENKTDAMLMAMANVTRQRVRAKTPTGKTKKLKGSWRTKKPKTFGKARVARVQTENRYGHVVEDGHIVVTKSAHSFRSKSSKSSYAPLLLLSPKTHAFSGTPYTTGGSTVGRNGRKLNVLQRGIRGVSVGGKTKGEKMIEDTVKELNATFEKNAKKLLDDLTSEVEL